MIRGVSRNTRLLHWRPAGDGVEGRHPQVTDQTFIHHVGCRVSPLSWYFARKDRFENALARGVPRKEVGKLPDKLNGMLSPGWKS
jgi:hypothetical protein